MWRLRYESTAMAGQKWIWCGWFGSDASYIDVCVVIVCICVHLGTWNWNRSKVTMQIGNSTWKKMRNNHATRDSTRCRQWYIHAWKPISSRRGKCKHVYMQVESRVFLKLLKWKHLLVINYDDAYFSVNKRSVLFI